MKVIMSVFGILLLCFVAMTNYTYANDKSWEYKDWNVSTHDKFVRYITNGDTVNGHQFGFIKMNENCNTDLLWISWSTYEDGIEAFKGSDATIQLRIGETKIQIEVPIISVRELTSSLKVIGFSNFVAGEKMISLLNKEHKIEVSIMAPKELVAKLDVTIDTFSLKGYTATMLKAKEFCEFSNLKTTKKASEEYDVKNTKPPLDDPKVFLLLLERAEQGDTDAQFILGRGYYYGEGIPQNHEQAAYWYEKVAEQGDVHLQFTVGVLYFMGDGVEQNFKKAAYWYKKATNQGHVEAQAFLGVLYEEGKGVLKDHIKAIVLYKKSADQGSAYAQFRLGLMYRLGRGVPKNSEEAIFWYTKAASQGFTNAQSGLGTMYYLGNGAVKNLKLGYAWLSLADQQGNEIANAFIANAKNFLSPQEIKEAQKLASEMQYDIEHPDNKTNKIDSTSISSPEHEPMIYDDGWKILTENQFTERMQKPVLNINYDTPYDFKLLDKNGNKVGWANTPAEYYKYRQKGNYLSSQTTYDQIDVDLFESTAMPLIYLSKAKPSKYSYVKDFPFNTKDPLSVLPVEFYSWVGSDERALVDKAISENRPWRHIDPNARILSETSFELIINYDGDGEEPRYVMNPVVLGDLNDDGYEDVVLDCAHYNVGHSGRWYYFRVLTRTSPNDVLKDITDEVDKSIWKIETTDKATTEANESDIFTNSSEAILFLENQLACILPPSPLKAIHRLVSEGLIEKKAFAHADSVSYFKVRKTFKVFGMPVSIVSAFDEGNRDNLWHEYFTRAPGTSPGNLIAVIIDWPKDKVKNHIIENEITGLNIWPADYPPYNIKKMATEIHCNGSFREREDLGILQSLQ